MNFWHKLKKPILVLAPMADVTDRAFRQIIAKYGKPDVMWTEFVSADGLFKGGRDSLINDLAFTESERPIIAQFFTSDPEMMRRSAELAVELGFDGVDINMGCPDKSVEKQGAGAGLIKNPKLAREIILAAKEGVSLALKNLNSKDSPSAPQGESLGDELTPRVPLGKQFENAVFPVSVKTRLGYNKNELETWLPSLLDAEPAVITIHARTRKEMSKVPARWEEVKRAVEIRNAWRDGEGKASQTLIFGNGDVTDIADATRKAEETGCDGVMLGRAIFGNPWLFASASKGQTLGNLDSRSDLWNSEIPIEQKLRVLAEHTHLFEKIVQPKPPVGQGKSFAVMKKHFKAYVNGFDGAKELRMKLMEAENATQVETEINSFLNDLQKMA